MKRGRNTNGEDIISNISTVLHNKYFKANYTDFFFGSFSTHYNTYLKSARASKKIGPNRI